MLVDQIKEQLETTGNFESLSISRGDLYAVADKGRLIEICEYLRENHNLQFDFLSMITATDYLGKPGKRFEVVYSLYSIAHHHRIMLLVRVDEEEEVPSLTGLWDTANFQEREVYDMFGLRFSGHPNLTRILMDDDWVGYPQRKDFPLTYETPEFSHNLDKIKVDDKTPGSDVF